MKCARPLQKNSLIRENHVSNDIKEKGSLSEENGIRGGSVLGRRKENKCADLLKGITRRCVLSGAFIK